MNKFSMHAFSALAALAVLLSLWSGTAEAYVGPGPGLTVLGALWAVIAAVLLAVLAIVRWPLRYLLRKIRGKGAAVSDKPDMPDAAGSGPEAPDEKDQ